MESKTKASIGVIAIVVLGLIVWSYVSTKNKQATTKSASQQEIKTPTTAPKDSPELQAPITKDQNTPISASTNNSNIQDSTAEFDPNIDTIVEPDTFLDITPEDCSDKCVSYEDVDDIKYCKEICGLAPKTAANVDCATLEDDLEKDYCLKDKGICDEIIDANIKKVCTTGAQK